MRKGQGSERVFKARSRNFELDPISRGNLLKAFVGRKGPSWEGPRGHLTQPPCYRWEVWGGGGPGVKSSTCLEPGPALFFLPKR